SRCGEYSRKQFTLHQTGATPLVGSRGLMSQTMEGLAERAAAESVRVQQPLVDAGDLRAVIPGHSQALGIERIKQRDEARRVPLGGKPRRATGERDAPATAKPVRSWEARKQDCQWGCM